MTQKLTLWTCEKRPWCKGDDRGQYCEDHGPRDGTRTTNSRFLGRQTQIFPVVVNALADHDRIINHNAKNQKKCEGR